MIDRSTTNNRIWDYELVHPRVYTYDLYSFPAAVP
jgi:hypothetical protein